MQGAAGSAGQWMSCKVGRRTRVAREIRSPGSIGVDCTQAQEEADVPKVLRGSKVPRTVREFSRTSDPEATVRLVRRL